MVPGDWEKGRYVLVLGTFKYLALLHGLPMGISDSGSTSGYPAHPLALPSSAGEPSAARSSPGSTYRADRIRYLQYTQCTRGFPGLPAERRVVCAQGFGVGDGEF